MSIKLMIAQMQSRLGDVKANVETVKGFIKEAASAKADVVVFPELCLCGRPLEEEFFEPELLAQVHQGLDEICQFLKEIPDLKVLLGAPIRAGDSIFNALFEIAEGKWSYSTKQFPQDEFESRVFEFDESSKPQAFEKNGVRMAVAFASDILYLEDPSKEFEGVNSLVVVDSDPFAAGRCGQRLENFQGLPFSVVYVNSVGAADALVFDGRSFCADSDGIKKMLPAFAECAETVKITKLRIAGEAIAVPELDGVPTIYEALKAGLKGYCQACGFKQVVLGLSGGIDSALVAKIAADVLGPENVEGILMPSQYSSEGSRSDAMDLAKNLGIKTELIPISPAFDAYNSMLSERFKGLDPDVTEENLQARVRGNLLMAVGNKTGRLVLATGNKSECAVGYSTLYGDLAGGYCPISDVWKTQVYEICRWLNNSSTMPCIPESILTKAPSAELRPGQKDQDSLPPYEDLDRILKAYVEDGISYDELIESGESTETVRMLLGKLYGAEFKRRQSPLGTKVSKAAFGLDWRVPVSSRYRPWK